MPKGVYEKEIRPAEERFSRYVEPEPMSGCWIWVGWTDRKGYGVLGLGRRGAGRMLAHRFSYRLRHGAIPEGMQVLHHCDLPACVNPDHLFLGTHQDNMADMWAKKRGPSGERQGLARLTRALVATILDRLRAGERGCDLATEYGVSRSTLTRIAKGQSWVRP